MAEPAQVPLWIDLAAVAFGGLQGGVFGTAGHDERNDFDILGVAVFAVVMGLGGGVIRDVLLGQVPAALRDDTYLLVAVLAGFAGMLLAEVAGRLRWTFDALDTVGASREVATGACLVTVLAVRMLALARGWRSPAPFVGSRRRP